MNGALILVIALMVVGVVAMGYSSYADGKEKERKRAERRKKRTALESKIDEVEAAFLAGYDDLDEDDPKDVRKALSKQGVELSELYKELAGYYPARTETHYQHLERSYQTLLKSLSASPTNAKVRVLALERGGSWRRSAGGSRG